jgi:sigma-E factor negative regulatory protein RseA
MNEQQGSQLSAMFDDELPGAECELLARRLSRDEALKARWERYALIGAAMRAERGVRPVLARRVTQALSAEAPLAAAAAVSPARPARPAWQSFAGGAALSAGVAAAAMLWMRAPAPQPTAAPLTVSAVTVAVADPSGGYGLRKTATSVSARRVVVPGTQLANYLVAHFEVSSPVAGQALLSALVAGEGGTATAASGSEERIPVEDVQDDAKTTVE